MPIGERRFLLDSHAFLWMTAQPNRLGASARQCIESSTTEVLLSVASVWELAIKSSLGKLDLSQPMSEFLRQQLAATRTSLLDVRADHALAVEDLPWHHRDPFDRLLIAQARIEQTPILSNDPAFDAYEVERIW